MLRSRVIPLLVAAAVLLLALAAGGCGNKKDIVTEASLEGISLELGPPHRELTYQVQISRQLNPRETEDRAFLAGLPAGQRTLHPNQAWFGVFLRVQNETSRAEPIATDFEIEDTQNNVYKPIPLSSSNPFAYQAFTLSGTSIYPLPSSPASDTSIDGALVLFKVNLSSFENRPLVFHVATPQVPQVHGSIELDV